MARVKAEQAARQQKIKAIEDFYRKSLTGGSISDASLLLEQLLLANKKLSQVGFAPKSIECTSTGCSLSYALNRGGYLAWPILISGAKPGRPVFQKTRWTIRALSPG